MGRAICVENLSKKYVIDHEPAPRVDTFRDLVAERLSATFQSLSRWPSRSERIDARQEEFWALKDVTFEVNEGDRFGIIGANGAGKSTLLKILSRVTEPSSGRVTINGRVSSLLEVGTGFHPELSGRENIYLNGVILGMSRSEVRRKFDEIVAFAEVEQFLDTPVKRYSSGMYVRLAFAVAAHLDPHVLIIDEVLAVGDQRFQRKCFSKIKDLGSTQGRTVLLVSHSMPTVRSICSKAVLLDKGRVAAVGDIESVIASYDVDIRSELSFGVVGLRNWRNRTSVNSGARIEWGQIKALDDCKATVHIGDDIVVTYGIAVDSHVVGNPIKLAVSLRTSDGIAIANMTDSDSGFGIDAAREQETVALILRDLRLYPGTYLVSLWVGSKDSQTWDYVYDCLTFEVKEGGALTQRRLPREAGLLFLTPEWGRKMDC